ncbi:MULTISPECIES: hypothetical protein [unclassified Marinobacterium]|uniref:hypothetical protein n=1 Tax=unclassified Marinobacterium TaxID=2644139 RepID=UPI001569FFE5|nr:MULTISPECIES: hypothetical protein [unclassified Marinobacterium]
MARLNHHGGICGCCHSSVSFASKVCPTCKAQWAQSNQLKEIGLRMSEPFFALVLLGGIMALFNESYLLGITAIIISIIGIKSAKNSGNDQVHPHKWHCKK